MSEKIIIPVETPGAQKAADDLTKVSTAAKGIGASAESVDKAKKSTAALADSTDKAKKSAEQLAGQNRRTSEGGAIDFDKLGKSAEKMGGSVGGVLQTVGGKAGAAGLAFAAIGPIVEQIGKRISDSMEEASQGAAKLSAAIREIEKAKRESESQLRKDASVDLEKFGPESKSAIAAIGEDGLKRAKDFAAAQGIDVSSAIKASVEGKRAGLSEQEIHTALMAGKSASDLGFGDVSSIASSAMALGADSLRSMRPEDLTSAAINAKAKSDHDKAQEDARKKFDDPKEKSNREAMEFQDFIEQKGEEYDRMVSEHDAAQRFGGKPPFALPDRPTIESARAGFSPSQFTPQEFKPPAGTSSRDVQEGLSRIGSSRVAADIDAAARLKSEQEARQRDDAARLGLSGAVQSRGEDAIRRNFPGFQSFLKKDQELAEKEQSARDRLRGTLQDQGIEPGKSSFWGELSRGLGIGPASHLAQDRDVQMAVTERQRNFDAAQSAGVFKSQDPELQRQIAEDTARAARALAEAAESMRAPKATQQASPE